MFAVLLIALGAGALAAQNTTIPGYLLTAQYDCYGDCYSWSVDVARVPTEFTFHEDDILAELLPPAPQAQRSFSILTAYNNQTRVSYYAALTAPRAAQLWTMAIDDNVTVGTLLSNTTLPYPVGASDMIRMHSAPKNLLLAIFDTGLVYSIDSTTGKSTYLGSLIANATFDQAEVTAASSVDYDNNLLYCIIKPRYGLGAYVVTMNLTTGQSTVAALYLHIFGVHKEDWSQENLFDFVWVPFLNKGLLFGQAMDPNIAFDQILWVDPANGEVTNFAYDLNEDLYGFTSDPSTKTDDTLQTATYDSLNSLIYFQCTQYQDSSDDSSGQTVIAMIDLLHPEWPINVAVTWTFGYMGFNFVPVISA